MQNTAANSNMQSGDLVRVRFCLLSEAGEQQTEPQELEFELGQEQIFPAVEQAILRAEVGQHLRIELSAEQAFGEHDKAACLTLPRSDFDAAMKLEPGAVISFALPSGEEVAGQVLNLNDDWVEVDFNHPLTGQSLICELDILSAETMK